MPAGHGQRSFGVLTSSGDQVRTVALTIEVIAAPVKRLDGRNQRQGRQPEEALDIFGRLEAVVEVLLEEGGTNAQAQSENHGHGQIEREIRAGRFARRLGWV